MRLQTLAVATAALSMTTAPALAAPANPAASLSVAKSVRASAPSAKSSKFAGNAIVPLVLGLGIVAGGIIIAVSDDKSKSK